MYLGVHTLILKTYPLYYRIDNILTQITTIINGISLKLRTAINLAYVWQLDAYLFRPDKCIEVLKNLNRRSDISLPFPVTMEQIAIYYERASLLGMKDSLDLYKIDSLPISTNDSLFIKLKPTYNYIAVSKDEDSFLPITDLEHCKQVSGVYLCKPFTAFLKGNSKLCEILDFKNKYSFNSTCEEMLFKTHPPLIKRFGLRCIYSVASPTLVKIQCHTKEGITRKEHIWYKIGIVSIPNMNFECSVFILN